MDGASDEVNGEDRGADVDGRPSRSGFGDVAELEHRGSIGRAGRCMRATIYDIPSALELEFLRLLTRDYPELQQQIERCEIATYDPTGWCNLLVHDAPPVHVVGHHLTGPLLVDANDFSLLDMVLSFDAYGMLQSIEIIEYGAKLVSADGPCKVFVEAAASSPSRLRYPDRGCVFHE